MALVAMAISDLGFTARVLHRLAGRRDHRRCTARPRSSTSRPGRITVGPRRGSHRRSSPASRASARTPRRSPRWVAAAPTPRRSRWRRRSGADVCEIYTDVDGVFTADPRIVPAARKLDKVSYEEMLELAACGAKILHLRCVEYARRYDIPIHVRSSFSQLEGTWVVDDPDRGRHHGTGHHRRRRARPQRGQDHRRRRARQGRRGRPHLRGARRGADQPRHDRAERLGRGHQPDRHLVHAAARRRPDRDGGAGQAPGRGRLRQAALRRQDRQGLADRRRHALAPRHHREVLRRAGRGGRQHRA